MPRLSQFRRGLSPGHSTAAPAGERLFRAPGGTNRSGGTAHRTGGRPTPIDRYRRFAEPFRKKAKGVLIAAVRAVLALLVISGTGGVGHALDRVRAETGVDLAAATFGVSGSGVIVAIMDRGIDWESNDFRNDDGTTRIAYIFDLSDDAGADSPGNTYGRGTIYTGQQINQALTAGTSLATRDAVGHGTATTGIAAGNGRNLTDRKYRGVASNATIISVKVTGGAPAHGNEPAEPHFYAGRPGIDVAIDFVLDKARELSMPVVMLLNLGSIGGPSDGTSALSRKIDTIVGPDHPGVVFVTGAGDDGVPSKTQNRAAGDVPDGGTVYLRFALDNGAGRLEVWYDENQALAVSVDTPISTLGPYPASQFHATGTGVRVFHYRGGDDDYGSVNGKRLLEIDFDGAAGAGEYILRLDHSGGATGSGIDFDATLNTPFGESGRFLNFVTPGSIWDVATTFRNVAPNSYVIRTIWTDIEGAERALTGEGDVGQLWTGSSTGPTVDGRIGVDVSAPGDRVVTAYAPRSHWASFRFLLIADGGELYGMAGAVSAAAPVVTGIIALMLEMDPTLDAVSVKSILQQTARADEFTGRTPNTLWGYGKVDAYAALNTVRLRTLEDGRENDGATYGVDDALPGVPTSGSFVPAALLHGSVSSSDAGTAIGLNDGGYFELSDGTRYTCTSADGCTVVNGTVTGGTVAGHAAGSGEIDYFPTFRTAVGPGEQTYTVGTAIDTLPLPQASSGNAPLSYRLTPAVPGLTFNAATRELGGTPSTAGTHAMTYSVWDEDGDIDTLSFTIAVQASGGDGSATEIFDLHDDHGYSSAIAYADGRFYVVDWLDGTVYAYTGTGEYDAVGDFDLHDDNGWPDGIAYADGRFYVVDWLDDKVYAYTGAGQHDAARDFDLHADNGNAEGIAYADGRFYVVDWIDDKVYAYTGAGQHDAAGDFDLHADNDTAEGIAYAGGRFYVIDATEDKVYPYGGVVAPGGADTSPGFASASGPGNRAYTLGTVIDTLTLPEASGGDGTLTYDLSPDVPGLSFNATSRQLTGIPTTADTHAMIYTATDEDGDTDTLDFFITVATLDDEGESTGTGYSVDDALPGVPTSGSFVPAALLDGSVSSTDAGTTISLDDGGYFELSDGTRYTCTSADRCTVANGTVTLGAVARRAPGSGDGDPPATPIGQGVSVTDTDQILVELAPEDIVPANPLDLASRTLMFTPDGRGGYSRSVRPLAWEEDEGDRVQAHAEVGLQFPFEYAARQWTSFFPSGRGMITFGEASPYRDERYVQRWGTMGQIASHLLDHYMISPLFKEPLAGWMSVSSSADRAVVTWDVWDDAMAVYGQRPQEGFSFQAVLYSDGRIQFNYGPQPEDPEEAFSDGIVGLFGLGYPRELIRRITDPVDPSTPAHLDLVETAFWHIPNRGSVLVEFTTRGPIPPVQGRELVYMLFLDTDEPWWTDRERERDDGDLWWYVGLKPDGETFAGGDANIAPAPRDDDDRIAFLVPLSEFEGNSATVFARTRDRDSETGNWGDEGNGLSAPALIEFPDAPAPTDLSRADTSPSTAQSEVFRYVAIRDREEGVKAVTCRIIEVLGDEFDFMAFNSQFRVDLQSAHQPGHGFAGYYAGNIAKLATGIGKEGDDVPPCESDRLTNTWGFPVWMKASGMEDRADPNPYDSGLTTFAHEIGHTWLASASYMADGERKSIQVEGGESHWALELHAPAPFPWRGQHNGSVMGGAYWHENSDGTFTATDGWHTRGGGFSWLDLYLMGLATPEEVPDMFILRNLRREGPCTFEEEWACERYGPFAADKETVTMEQVLAATGTRNPPPERARKAFNVGFVYFVLPGQEPDPNVLRKHAQYRDRAVAHWRRITGGRGQLTTEIPGRFR